MLFCRWWSSAVPPMVSSQSTSGRRSCLSSSSTSGTTAWHWIGETTARWELWLMAYWTKKSKRIIVLECLKGHNLWLIWLLWNVFIFYELPVSSFLSLSWLQCCLGEHWWWWSLFLVECALLVAWERLVPILSEVLVLISFLCMKLVCPFLSPVSLSVLPTALSPPLLSRRCIACLAASAHGWILASFFLSWLTPRWSWQTKWELQRSSIVLSMTWRMKTNSIEKWSWRLLRRYAIDPWCFAGIFFTLTLSVSLTHSLSFHCTLDDASKFIVADWPHWSTYWWDNWLRVCMQNSHPLLTMFYLPQNFSNALSVSISFLSFSLCLPPLFLSAASLSHFLSTVSFCFVTFEKPSP